jgi:outer membrane protein
MINFNTTKGKRMFNKYIIRKAITAALVICFGFALSNLHAQTISDSTITLTLDKAISMALENNRDIMLAGKDLQNADAQIDEAYADVWPKIDFSGNYTRNLKLPVLFIPPNSPFNPTPNTEQFSLGADNSYTFGLSLNQTLFSLKINTAVKIADQYYNYYKTNMTSTQQDVVYQVKQAFYAVLLSEKLLDVNQKSYDVAKANYDNVAAMYKQGVSSEYDFLRAKVQLANVQPALIEAKNNLMMAKNSLKNLLSIGLDTDINVVGEFKLEKISEEELNKAKEILIKDNPTLQGLNLESSILDKNISLQTAGYFPTLSAFANYGWQAQDNTFKFSNYSWANSFAVGLSLSVPIFDGFRRKAQIEEAEISKDKVEITKNKLEEGLKTQLTQAELQMDEAKERVEAQQQSVEEANKALQISQTRYNNGIGTQLEILDTQSALTETQTNYEKAIYDFLIAKAEWEKLIGKSVSEQTSNK